MMAMGFNQFAVRRTDAPEERPWIAGG